MRACHSDSTPSPSRLATCSLTPLQAAGTYDLVASFAGNDRFLSSSTTIPFVVTKLPTALTYSGATTGDCHDPVPVLPAIQLTELAAYSQSDCDGAGGQATLGSLVIGGVPIPIGLGPNVTIPLPLGGRITINEQLADQDADPGLTVIGAHIVVPPMLGLVGVDIALASATSGIHHCRPSSSGAPVPLDEGAEGGDADDAAASNEAAAGADAAGADAAGADAARGGCHSTRSSAAVWLVALALVAARRRSSADLERARRRGRAISNHGPREAVPHGALAGHAERGVEQEHDAERVGGDRDPFEDVAGE